MINDRMDLRVIIVCILSTLLIGEIRAFPTGIGSCLPGLAAVQGGAHRNVLLDNTGLLGDSGFEVRIDGELLIEDVPKSLSLGEHRIDLIANQDFFRGFLMRIGSNQVFTRDMLRSDDVNVQVPTLCTNLEFVGGLCHTDREAKYNATGTLVLDAPATDLQLDVTVVVKTILVINLGEWYFSRYTLRAVENSVTESPLPPPTQEPTQQPTQQPTPSPTVPLTPPPTQAPTDPPTMEPTSAPVQAPPICQETGQVCSLNDDCCAGFCRIRISDMIGKCTGGPTGDGKQTLKLSQGRGGAAGIAKAV